MRRIQIKEFVRFVKGKTPAQINYYGPDAKPYLTPDYLRGEASAEPIKPSSNAVNVAEGETIVLWDGSNAGEVMRAKFGTLASTMTRLHHSNEFLPGYFFYALKKWEPFLKGQTSGSGIPHVDKEVLGNLEILLFDKPEQSKIAEVLSTVDREIEQTEAMIAKQQRIKTSLIHDLLTRGIDEHGNLRSEETHEFKDSPLGRIPVEWQINALKDIVDEDITYGIVQAGPHMESGIPYIRTGDMAGDTINVEMLLRTSPQIAKLYKRSTVSVGDIVFALRATVGKVLPITSELDGANLTQGTAKISPKESIDSDFLLWALRTSQVQDAIRLQQKGTTFMEITLADMRNIQVALPMEKNEQSLIAETLNQHERLYRDYIIQRNKLASIKTALMQDLLTGKTRVTPLLEKDQQEACA